MTSPTPAGWFPDPTGRFEHRFWDGARWTEHVVTQGRHSVSPIDSAPPVDAAQRKVVRQVQKKAGVAPVSGGTGHLLDEPVLVVNQKAKLFEHTAEFAVYDQHGRQLGSVVQVGKSPVSHPLGRILRELDKLFTPRFEFRDTRGAVLFTVTKPFLQQPEELEKAPGYRVRWSSRKGWLQVPSVSRYVVVAAPDGREIGRVWQENRMGFVRFHYDVGGQRVGGMQAENWLSWDLALLDAHDNEVGRITKTWEGFAKAAFTVADNYVVQIHRRLEEPLRTMVVASSITVDCVLKDEATITWNV